MSSSGVQKAGGTPAGAPDVPKAQEWATKDALGVSAEAFKGMDKDNNKVADFAEGNGAITQNQYKTLSGMSGDERDAILKGGIDPTEAKKYGGGDAGKLFAALNGLQTGKVENATQPADGAGGAGGSQPAEGANGAGGAGGAKPADGAEGKPQNLEEAIANLNNALGTSDSDPKKAEKVTKAMKDLIEFVMANPDKIDDEAKKKLQTVLSHLTPEQKKEFEKLIAEKEKPAEGKDGKPDTTADDKKKKGLEILKTALAEKKDDKDTPKK